MSTHNLCFEQKYEKYQNSLSENSVFGGEISIYLNRRVFIMDTQEMSLSGSTAFKRH